MFNGVHARTHTHAHTHTHTHTHQLPRQKNKPGIGNYNPTPLKSDITQMYKDP